jgi:hypothetical protein
MVVGVNDDRDRHSELKIDLLLALAVLELKSRLLTKIKPRKTIGLFS